MKIQDIARIYSGYKEQKEKPGESQYRCLKMKDRSKPIAPIYGKLNCLSLLDKVSASLPDETYLTQKNDIIVKLTAPWVAFGIFEEAEENILVQQPFCIIRPGENIPHVKPRSIKPSIGKYFEKKGEWQIECSNGFVIGGPEDQNIIMNTLLCYFNSSLFLNKINKDDGKQTQKLRVSDLPGLLQIPNLPYEKWVEISKGYILQRNVSMNVANLNTAITRKLEALIENGLKK